MGRLGLAEAAEDAVRRRSGRRPRPRRPAPARSCGDDARSASGHASCTRVLAGEARRSDRHSLSRADPPGPLHGRERDPARPLAARTGRRDRRRPALTRARQPVQPRQRRHVGDARHAPRRAADARLDRRGALGRRCASDRGGAPRRPGRRRPVGERPPRAALPGARAVPRRDRERPRARARGPRGCPPRNGRHRGRSGQLAHGSRRRRATRPVVRGITGSRDLRRFLSRRRLAARRRGAGVESGPLGRRERARRSATAPPAADGRSSRRSSGRKTSCGSSGRAVSPSMRSSRPVACRAVTHCGRATSASRSLPPTAPGVRRPIQCWKPGSNHSRLPF